MAAPKLSIIVPVYNTEKYLKQCVDSLTSQTLNEIEIILVDDGSKAECARVCDELAASEYTQNNVMYYFEDNKKILHRYINNEDGFKIDGKEANLFDVNLISGFEKERVTGYAEPLDIYEGYINRAQQVVQW